MNRDDAKGFFWDGPADKAWEMRSSRPATIKRAGIEGLQARPSIDAAPLSLPPGNAGIVAKWVLDSSLLPVTEIAIVATLGLLAGICGRAWVTHPKPTGMNLYIILVAKSAVGKEAMHESVGKLSSELRKLLPAVSKFVNFDEYASGPALAKACAEPPRNFLNVSSEFGRKLKRMSNFKDSPMAELRTVMLNLYSKSGPASTVGDLVYSEKRHTISSAVAFSMIGETTPGTLRLAMTPDMMEDGFLSRFQFVEYTGERPDTNEAAAMFSEPPQSVVAGLAAIAQHSHTLLSNSQTCTVLPSPTALVKLDIFKGLCSENIKAAGENESLRQVWNRAHLKALKIASLLAIADGYSSPFISEEHAAWAIELVSREALAFARQINEGDVGADDDVLAKKLTSIIRRYFESPPDYATDLHAHHIIPQKFLQGRTANVAAFKSHPQGANKALEATLRRLCDGGVLNALPPHKVLADHGYRGKCFELFELPHDS